MFRLGFREMFLAALLFVAMLAYFGTGIADDSTHERLRSSCWTTGTLSEDAAKAALETRDWHCADEKPPLDAERVLLRFDASAGPHPLRYFLSRRSALEGIHLFAVDRDQSVRQTYVPAERLASSMAGGYFKVPLPQVTDATRWVIVAIDLPSHRMTLEQAYLAPTDPANGVAGMRFLLFLAGLGGMLLMPLLFNAAFYRVLREPFVLWHSALALSLLTTIFISSGLSVVFFEPSAMTLNWMTALVFGITLASGMMFTHSFIEPGLMHPRLRRLLPYCAAWAMLLSAFHAAFPFVARSVQSSLYTAAFAPVMIVFIIAMKDALARGSRAARFQAVGYLPMVMVGLIRLVTGVLPWSHSADAMVLFYMGCVSEVLFTTLGMADRFVTMKRERDSARSEIGTLERLSETDPLTGLLNRRAIEREFEQLQTEGFSMLAVVDLDDFKAINDRYGHSVGDAVLQATAHALQSGPDVRAYRFGGEEFVLLLRGEDSDRQAEASRMAIPLAISTLVPEIAQQVTASMGITQLAAGEPFIKPYERADELLYAAKYAGKNRGLSALPQAATSSTGSTMVA